MRSAQRVALREIIVNTLVSTFIQSIVTAILSFGQKIATLFLPQFYSNRFEISPQ